MSGVAGTPAALPASPFDGVITPGRRWLDAAVGRGIEMFLARLAADATGALADGPLLVLAPHPDDETLACGGTIARTRDGGGRVVVAVATDGRHGDPRVSPPAMAATRAQELLEAMRLLGVPEDDLVRFEFEDATLSAHREQLMAAVSDLVDRCRPHVIIGPVPWDLHPDHAALGRCLSALAARGHRCWGYLVWGWDHPRLVGCRGWRASGGRPGDRVRRPVAVNVAGTLERKAAAVAAHRSQFSPDARFAGRPIRGTGPLGNDVLRRFDGHRELFFPMRCRPPTAAEPPPAEPPTTSRTGFIRVGRLPPGRGGA